MHKQSHETFPLESRLVTRNRPPPIRRPPPRATSRRRTRRSTSRSRDRARAFSNRAFLPRSRASRPRVGRSRDVHRVRRSSRAAATAAESDPSDRPMCASRRCLAPAIDVRARARTKGNTPASLARGLARVERSRVERTRVERRRVERRVTSAAGAVRDFRVHRDVCLMGVFDGTLVVSMARPSHDRTPVVCGRKAHTKEDLCVQSVRVITRGLGGRS